MANYYKRMGEAVLVMTGKEAPQSYPWGTGSLWTSGRSEEGHAHWHLYVPSHFVDRGSVVIRHAAGKSGIFAILDGKEVFVLQDGRAWQQRRHGGISNIYGWEEVLGVSGEAELAQFVEMFEIHAARYAAERFHDCVCG